LIPYVWAFDLPGTKLAAFFYKHEHGSEGSGRKPGSRSSSTYLKEGKMVQRLNLLFGNRRGFTLIELLIVILIVGILAAVAAPLYLGYIKDAKTAEGKSVAGALWTSVQAMGVAACNTTVAISGAYPRAGMDSGGNTTDGRWKTTAGSGIAVNCDSGAITPPGDVFTLDGNKPDITNIQIKLNYNTSNNPPAQLICSPDNGTTTAKC
jgi:type IV pilus assembly protein PilA